MNELMIFEGHEVEAFELNGEVLFNPYHVGACLDMAMSIRATTAPTRPSAQPRATPRRGCTTRGATSIIWNTGSITAPPRPD